MTKDEVTWIQNIQFSQLVWLKVAVGKFELTDAKFAFHLMFMYFPEGIFGSM